MSTALCQGVPLQSQLTSEPISKASCGTGTRTPEHRSTAYVRAARTPRHTAGPLHLPKKHSRIGEREQDAEYTMPLVTTGIYSFRGVETRRQI